MHNFIIKKYTVIKWHILLQTSGTYLFARWLIVLAFIFLCWIFFKIKFLQKNHAGLLSKCQTVWIQIQTNILLVLI